MKQSGKVYLIKARGHNWYKVGKSRKASKRLRWLYTHLPFEVDLIHAIDTDNIDSLESYFKKLFNERRIRGEWFDLRPVDIEKFCGYIPTIAPGEMGLLVEIRRRDVVTS